MLPKDATRVPCSLLQKASPRSLNPDVGKHSKHVCLILRFPGYQAVCRRSQSAWSSRIQQRPQNCSQSSASRPSQPESSAVCQSAADFFWAAVARWLLNSSHRAHGRACSISPSLSLSLSQWSLSIHKILLIFSMATFIKQEQKRREASHRQDAKTNVQEDKTDCNELQMCQSKLNCGLIFISSKV